MQDRSSIRGRRLGISARRLAGRRLGVGRYIEYLLREWARGGSPFDEVALYSRDPIGPDLLALSGRYRNELVTSPIETLYWEQIALAWTARRDDVLFCPSYTMPLFRRGRTVIMNHGIYDGLPDSFPRWYRMRHAALNRLSAQRADLVLAISESAKRDLIKYYKLPREKIRVVLPAADERFHPIEDQQALRAIRSKYDVGDAPVILFVGKLSRRRHVPELVRAFSQLKSRQHWSHRLIIAGPDYLNTGISRIIEQSGCKADIIHLPFVDHDDMPLLYNVADLYVLPTEHEGFSFTIMEAMGCGRPVLTLDHPSLHEGLFEAAFCARDSSAEALYDAMHTLLSDPDLRANLGFRGRELCTRLSWARAASETLNQLDRISGGSARSTPRLAADTLS
jgi:glycosyltransferase involved in cell wall biosynthesis